MAAMRRRHHEPFDMVPSILYSLYVKKIPVTEVSLVARIDQIYLPSWWNRCLQKDERIEGYDQEISIEKNSKVNKFLIYTS